MNGKIWKIIWSMKIPSKVKVFIWKLCVDAIPCFYELWKRKIKNSSDCPVCRRELETIEYMLFLCEWTMGVWCNACSGLRLDRNTMTRFDVWLQKVVERLRGNKEGNELMLTKIILTCWNVWKKGCVVVFLKKQVQVLGVISRNDNGTKRGERNGKKDGEMDCSKERVV